MDDEEVAARHRIGEALDATRAACAVLAFVGMRLDEDVASASPYRAWARRAWLTPALARQIQNLAQAAKVFQAIDEAAPKRATRARSKINIRRQAAKSAPWHKS